MNINHKTQNLLLITNAPELISSPNKNFTIHKEITLKDNSDTLIYSIQQNFTENEKTNEMIMEEEKYQKNCKQYKYNFKRNNE